MIPSSPREGSGAGQRREQGRGFVYRHGPSMQRGCWKQSSAPGSFPLPAPPPPLHPPLLSAPKKDHSLLHNGMSTVRSRARTHGRPLLNNPFFGHGAFLSHCPGADRDGWGLAPAAPAEEKGGRRRVVGCSLQRTGNGAG